MASNVNGFLKNLLIVYGITVLIAFLVYGQSIFYSESQYFQFVIFGLAAALFYAGYKYYGLKITLIIVAVWLLVQAILLSNSFENTLWFIRDVVFFAAVAGAVYYFIVNIERKINSLPYLTHPLGMALLMMAGYILATVVLVIINLVFANPDIVLGMLLINARIGFILGLFLGVGVIINSLVKIK